MSKRPLTRHPLFQLTLLRFREFAREPEALFWALAFPVLLATGLGIAFRHQAPDRLPVAVVSHDLALTLQRDPQLVVRELPASAARDALRLGQVLLVAEPGAGGRVLFRFDDTNPEGRAARLLADRAVQVAAGRADPVGVADDVVREPGARYIDFLIPGIVGMGIMGNGIWGLGFTIVDARRRKMMKRLVATPMPKAYYLLSFLLWRLLLLVVEVSVPIGYGALVFGVPVRGHMVELAAIAIAGSLAFSALGLLIAARPRTIEAASGIMNLVMVPMWIFSGVFFSSARFPDAVQPLIKALPLTALIDAMRANMLQGTSLVQLAPQLSTLACWLVVCFAVAMRIFRWR